MSNNTNRQYRVYKATSSYSGEFYKCLISRAAGHKESPTRGLIPRAKAASVEVATGLLLLLGTDEWWD